MISMRMTFALICLSFALPAVAQTRAEFEDLRHRVEVLEQKSSPNQHTENSSIRSIKLNGGLEATILSLGRNKRNSDLTVSVRIRNMGKNIAYLAGVLQQSGAVDNTGVHFQGYRMWGVANCNANSSNPASICLGIGNENCCKIPIQSFTRLDPSPQSSSMADGIVINFVFTSNGAHSDGPFVSMSMNLLCRFVQDADVDQTLSENDQYRQFRLMTLSFPAQLVTETN
jgi:hypothetical protein